MSMEQVMLMTLITNTTSVIIFNLVIINDTLRHGPSVIPHGTLF